MGGIIVGVSKWFALERQKVPLTSVDILNNGVVYRVRFYAQEAVKYKENLVENTRMFLYRPAPQTPKIKIESVLPWPYHLNVKSWTELKFSDLKQKFSIQSIIQHNGRKIFRNTDDLETLKL